VHRDPGLRLVTWTLRSEETGDGEIRRKSDEDFPEGAMRLVRETPAKPIAKVARGCGHAPLAARLKREGRWGDRYGGSWGYDGDWLESAVVLLGEMQTWRIAERQWDRVAQIVQEIEIAVASGQDLAAERTVIELELAGP
jgi:CATRA-Associated Small Protein